MNNVLVFDLETVPDVRQARAAHELRGASDRQVADWMFSRRSLQTRGASEVLRPHQQRIIVVGALLQCGERFKLWCLGNVDGEEIDLVRGFFRLLERYRPVLVSWNGRSFDLPVLHYRALLHGVSAPAYWSGGRSAYVNRYGMRHVDLMDVLANYDGRAAVSLQEIALLLGLPGKSGMDGASVWDQYLADNLQGVRNYCEIDVLNTYLLYLRFDLLRGGLNPQAYRRQLAILRAALSEDERPHVLEFLEHWQVEAEPPSEPVDETPRELSETSSRPEETPESSF